MALLKGENHYFDSLIMDNFVLLCSSTLFPQICGGLGPPGLETENTSVRHLVASVAVFPAKVVTASPDTCAIVVIDVSGWLMTKSTKSSLN